MQSNTYVSMCVCKGKDDQLHWPVVPRQVKISKSPETAFLVRFTKGDYWNFIQLYDTVTLFLCDIVYGKHFGLSL